MSTRRSEQLEGLIATIAASGMAGPDMGVLERRAVLAGLESQAVAGVEVRQDLLGGVPVERLVPEGAKGGRGLLWLHGGAYTGGGPGSHRGFCSRLAERLSCEVVVADYRLAPEHPHPAALEDARAVWVALLEGSEIPADRWMVGGDSAGGGLTMALLVALREAGEAMPAAGLLLSPWTDLAMTGESYETEAARDPLCTREGLAPSAEAYLGGIDPTTPSASPRYADLGGLPPLVIHVGECEVLRDDALALARSAGSSGTEVELWIAPGMIHVWHLFAGLVPEADAALERLAVSADRIA